MIFLGHGIVWDKETNKQLCRFIDGKFETDDIAIIIKLKEKYAYEVEGIVEETKEIEHKKKVRK